MNPQIKAKILADSISVKGERITSFELELPRFVWAEVLTHRQFSRNAGSSRAIPVAKSTKMIKKNPAQPSLWGANKPGMQSDKELTGAQAYITKKVWNLAAYSAATFSQVLAKLGLHKQYANRVSEYAQMYKVVVTATEFDNFFHLRCHKDAQPDIRELAEAMQKAMADSTPQILPEGAWHLPYIVTKASFAGTKYFSNGKELTLEQAQKVSASCCAQISYRLLNFSLEKAEKIYDALVTSKPVHASPFEHAATPMPTDADLSVEGITHLDSKGNLWSGNLKGWIQYRQLIKGNVYEPFKTLDLGLE